MTSRHRDRQTSRDRGIGKHGKFSSEQPLLHSVQDSVEHEEQLQSTHEVAPGQVSNSEISLIELSTAASTSSCLVLVSHYISNSSFQPEVVCVLDLCATVDFHSRGLAEKAQKASTLERSQGIQLRRVHKFVFYCSRA